MTHAWTIDKDHVSALGGDVGTMGPRLAHPQLLAYFSMDHAKPAGFTVYRFSMRDDDGELYYTGRLITDNTGEDACYAPLGDFGMPNAGAVEVTYHGHPEMDCAEMANTDQYVVDAIATMLGTTDEWRSPANYLESIARLIGEVRPFPGTNEIDPDKYAADFTQATGRNVIARYDARD